MILKRGTDYMIYCDPITELLGERGVEEMHCFFLIMGITHLLNYITTDMECPLLRAMLAYWSRSLSFFFVYLLHYSYFSFDVYQFHDLSLNLDHSRMSYSLQEFVSFADGLNTARTMLLSDLRLSKSVYHNLA